MLEKICRQKAGLSDEDINILKKIESTIQYIADIVGSDIFIDCFYDNGTKCVVVAEAKPSDKLSGYGRSVVGEDALEENEPAVFAVQSSDMPVRDLRATTQENKTVRQDVVPIKNNSGTVIGVLIREKDIGDQIWQDKKYIDMVRTVEQLNEKVIGYESETNRLLASGGTDDLMLKEIHHRIKNNLQMVASILNMQARRSSSPEMRSAFKDNVNRVLSFAVIHEILTQGGLGDIVHIFEIIEKVRLNTITYANNGEKKITIKIVGEDFTISSEKATSIAIVVNELLANAVEHAFVDRLAGQIIISVKHGIQYSTITITDDGAGFNFENRTHKTLGLSIVELTVHDKLKGKLRLSSGAKGSIMRFDFQN